MKPISYRAAIALLASKDFQHVAQEQAVIDFVSDLFEVNMERVAGDMKRATKRIAKAGGAQ